MIDSPNAPIRRHRGSGQEDARGRSREVSRADRGSVATAGYGGIVPPTPPGRPEPQAGPAPSSADVEVRRSRRRKRTVTAFREGGRTIVAIPERFTRVQEREWVRRMVARLESQEQRRRPSDAQLAARADELSRQYLDGRARPTSVAWSGRQGRRWGSCSVADGAIRISTRMQGMPAWVLDYVLLHELAHLLSAGHGPEFWALLAGYPRTDRARGFLDGYSFASDTGADVGEEPSEQLEPLEQSAPGGSGSG